MYSIGNQGKIMRKLLGKPTPDAAHDSPAVTVTSSPLAPHYRPTASQDVVFDAGAPVACLDSSPDGRSAVVAGRHVLKTLVFDGLAVREGIDLRALLVAQPAQRNSIPTSVADQLSVKAVKWGEPQGKQAIFTAGIGGKIFQYDLLRAGTAAPGSAVDFVVQIREDSRQVNALDINPHRNSWLLSGSQDGIVRCFDVRQPTQTRAGATFRSIQAFKSADAVHHVQWNPRDGFLFACGTEQGSVVKWDMRKPSAAILRIKAHEKTCTAMAWHPDGIHLASAGVDSRCYIWDMAKDKRQKPKWTLSTPAPAGVLAWRPGQWSATAQGKRASQLAMSYDESSQKRYGINVAHVWDLARPTMPYKELARFDSSPSAMLWHDQYLLWTAGQDGIFSQCDMSFAPKVIDRQAVSTMAFSPRGDVLMLLDERAPPHRPRPHILHHDAIPVSSYSSSPTTPRFSVSRSDSEDDAIGSFIGPRRRGSRRRRPSTRSTATLSTTPPAGPAVEDVMSLEQTIKATGIHKSQQAMAVGHVPAAADVEVYGYLATNYLEALQRDLPYSPGAGPLPERVATILEHYARAAANVKQFRLAQTWRILAYAVDMLLRRRAQYHLERRMDRHHYSARRKSEAKAKAKAKALAAMFDAQMRTIMDDEATPRRITSLASFDKALHPRSLLSEELESTSNVPTPVARPVADDPSMGYSEETGRGRRLTPIVEPESFTLPPAAHPASLSRRTRLNSVPLSIASHDSAATLASTEGYDFYDTDAIAKAIDVPSPRPTPTQVLDYRGPGSPSRTRRPMMRQDSEESYVHLFSISDESRRATGLTTSSDGSLTGQTARAAILAGLRDGHGDELPSRIRGKGLEESPGRMTTLPFRGPLQRTETDMTAFTDEHHAITQTTTDSFESRFPSQTTDHDFLVESPVKELPPPESPDAPDDEKSPFIVETDYLCWPDDAPYPFPAHPSSTARPASSPPLQPYVLIARALAFEAKSSALNASAIVLLLKPLLPDDTIDDFQAAAILRQHHSRLMSMKLFTEAALLRKLCMQGWPGAPLARWGANYPAIFTAAQQGVQASFVCSGCHKPRDLDRMAGSTESVWTCERCRAVMAPCAVCGERESAPRELGLPSGGAATHADGTPSSGGMGAEDEEETLSTWWYCPGCGHGGHSSCLHAWHAAVSDSLSAAGDRHQSYSHHHSLHSNTRYPNHSYHIAALDDAPGAAESSAGCCPLDGCGHVCLPGRRGQESALVVREATRAVAKANAAAAEVAAAAAAAGPGAVGGSDGGVGGVGAEGGGFYMYGAGEVPYAPLPGVDDQQHGELGAASVGGGGMGGGRHHPHHPASVRSDGNDVPQSRAVETVRETLGSASGGLVSGGRTGTGILSSSPGRGGGIGLERERRKSVKFVATEDRR